MNENCARPGCGHRPGGWEAGGELPVGGRAYGHMKARLGAYACIECDCPGYRTEEQQEAWEFLRAMCSVPLGDGGTDGSEMWRLVAKRLLELYP